MHTIEHAAVEYALAEEVSIDEIGEVLLVEGAVEEKSAISPDADGELGVGKACSEFVDDGAKRVVADAVYDIAVLVAADGRISLYVEVLELVRDVSGLVDVSEVAVGLIRSALRYLFSCSRPRWSRKQEPRPSRLRQGRRT